MAIEAKAFWLPKHGSTEAEYEDAYSISIPDSRFAIADGATEASFSGMWAKQLVRAFTGKKIAIPLQLEELKPLQARWHTFVHRNPLPWYAEEKVSNGAFAAFLGLELSEENTADGLKRNWQVSAAGDTCLVQIRGNSILEAFPYKDSGSFNNHPDLLGSANIFNENSSKLISHHAGTWGCEDVFFLMTDALACWFFKSAEQGQEPWNILRDLDTEAQVSFKDFVAGLRSSSSMKNDDVTLVRVDILA
ncbi:MAG: hypothetical protein WCH99_17030 [Verrucomicrobiota bacterium]